MASATANSGASLVSSAGVLTDPERGDRQRGQPPGQLVQEPLGSSPASGCVGLEGPEAVDHDQPWAMLS